MKRLFPMLAMLGSDGVRVINPKSGALPPGCVAMAPCM